MRVLHIIDSGGLYGAEMVLLNLVEEQLRQGVGAMIASIGVAGIAEKPVEVAAARRNLPLQRFRFRPGLNFSGAWQILAYAKSEKVQILHSHGYKGNILFGFMPKTLRRLPLVVTLHGWTSTRGLSKMRIYEWLDARSLPRADQVVLVNQEMRHHPRFPERLGNYRVIDNGIPLQYSGDDELEQSIVEFCQRGRTLCAIGRLSLEKGFALLIEALPELQSRHADIQLLILGEGGQRGNLERLVAAHGLDNRVLMPGYRPHASGYLSNCQCLVMPSHTEGLPITLLEAMRAGIPVIASRVGGIPDVLDQGACGLLVEKGSVAELIQAVDLLFSSREKTAEYTAKATAKFHRAYSAENMARRYFEVYSDLLEIKA